MPFSIHEIAWMRTGTPFGSSRVIEYRVQGASPCNESFVANFGSWQKDNWKILRVKDGLCAEWTESFSSAAEAFDYLIS